MNIIIDVRPLMGGNHSGVEIYIRNLLTQIFKIDQKNNYFLFANGLKDQTQHFSQFKQKNVTIIQTKIPNKIFNLSLFLFKRPKIDKIIAKKLKNNLRFDLYFQPDLRPSAIGKNIKKISVIHDLSFHHLPRFFSLKTRLWHKLLNPKNELKSSNKIIAVSNFTKEDLIKSYQIKPEKISVIYEGVNENMATRSSIQELEKIREKYKLPKNYLLFLSTLEPRKNMSRLITAFKEYKKENNDDLKLVLAGKENERIFANLKLEQDSNLIYCGFIDEADKAGIFQLAKAFIYPSLFEGFGLPLLEAMKTGTPIITSDLSSMPEIVGDAAILIDPKNTNEIKAAIKTVQNPLIIKELKSKMAIRIQKFSWEKCARETINLFTETAQRH